MPADMNTTAGVRVKVTDWVQCPICHEPDMPFRRDPDGDGGGYISCLNLSCPSNAILAALPSAGPAPVVGSVEERAKAAREMEFARKLRGAADDSERSDDISLDTALRLLRSSSRLLLAAAEKIEALAADALTLPEQATPDRAGEETAAQLNARFDPADEAGQEVFSAGWKCGWMFARYPDGWDADAEEDYARQMEGSAMGEAWEGHRQQFFARLPLQAVDRPRLQSNRKDAAA